MKTKKKGALTLNDRQLNKKKTTYLEKNVRKLKVKMAQVKDYDLRMPPVIFHSIQRIKYILS